MHKSDLEISQELKQKALFYNPIPHIKSKIISSRTHEIFQIIAFAMLEFMPLEVQIISQLERCI